jgi:hypothetical protein
MPWESGSAYGHSHKANTPKKQRAWSHVANGSLGSGDSEGSAVRQANAVVSRMARGGVVYPWDDEEEDLGIDALDDPGDEYGAPSPDLAAMQNPFPQPAGPGRMPLPRPQLTPGPAAKRYEEAALRAQQAIDYKPGRGRSIAAALLSIPRATRGIAADLRGDTARERVKQSLPVYQRQAEMEEGRQRAQIGMDRSAAVGDANIAMADARKAYYERPPAPPKRYQVTPTGDVLDLETGKVQPRTPAPPMTVNPGQGVRTPEGGYTVPVPRPPTPPRLHNAPPGSAVLDEKGKVLHTTPNRPTAPRTLTPGQQSTEKVRQAYGTLRQKHGDNVDAAIAEAKQTLDPTMFGEVERQLQRSRPKPKKTAGGLSPEALQKLGLPDGAQPATAAAPAAQMETQTYNGATYVRRKGSNDPWKKQ